MGTESVQKSNTSTPTTSNYSKTTSANVVKLPITIDENNVIDGAREVLKIIRPTWTCETIDFKLFTDGITNKLVGCFHKKQSTKEIVNGLHENTINNICKTDENDKNYDNDIDEQNDVVLIRVYGNKTDLLIDRKAETKNILLLHTYGFAPSLFATFINGLAYEYVPGYTLKPDTIIKPNIYPLIAIRMAEMHKVKANDCVVKNPMLKSKLKQFFNLIPDKFSDPVKNERIQKLFPTLKKFENEFNDLYAILMKLNSPIVFAHNDLLLGNIIYTEKLNQVTFIDYEYADYNYQAFDIGNHFTEFAGIDEIDYNRYPKRDFQLKWLRIYLETYKYPQLITDKDVERLYIQVNQFALAAHFLWTVWSLIQAEHSSIDFDFVEFGSNRYNEYLNKKDLFLSYDINNL